LGLGYKCATSCEVGALGLARADVMVVLEYEIFRLETVEDVSVIYEVKYQISYTAIRDIYLEIVDL
jgi:hypothetical protein